MKNNFIFLLLGLLIYYGCKPNSNKSTTSGTENGDTTHFFEVSQYIQSQIAEVNKTPYFIYKIDIINGKKDSIVINNSVFNQIAATFLKQDINDKAIKKFYTESIFHDQTTKSFAIGYTTSNKQLEIQNVDILLQEDGHTVKRVFIRRFVNYPDSAVIEQLSWKQNESFQINRLVQKGSKENTYQTDVVWNEKS